MSKGVRCQLGRDVWFPPGWPINNRTGPILLPSYPLTYINLQIWKQSNKDFLSYRENDEVSVDAA